jgi:drug/metabolite transporter (DMT)-like permease
VSYIGLGSLSIGASFVYARRFMAHLDLSPLALCTYQVGFALCILAAVTPLSGLSHVQQSATALIGVVLGLGLTGTGIAYVLYYYIVWQMGAVQASSVTYLPPVVALLIGCLLVGEPLRWMDLIAMSAILSGVFAIQTPVILSRSRFASIVMSLIHGHRSPTAPRLPKHAVADERFIPKTLRNGRGRIALIHDSEGD